VYWVFVNYLYYLIETVVGLNLHLFVVAVAAAVDLYHLNLMN